MRVNNNIAALNAGRHLNSNNRVLKEKLERLASGLRINRAADDAAGLAVSEGMRAELAGLRVSAANAEQATNLIMTAEGSLNEINGILIRMRELATQGASSTVTDDNREATQKEFAQMSAEINRIAEATSYNNQILLTGFGNKVEDGAKTTATHAKGVANIQISGAQAGSYTFEDKKSDDGEITLGNGTVTQTIDIATVLDGKDVATGTQVVANFDRLGIQVTLGGDGVKKLLDDGSEVAVTKFTDGMLNDAKIEITNVEKGGVFQVGPANSSWNRIEVGVRDMRASGDNLNLKNVAVGSIGGAQEAMSSIDQAIRVVAHQRGDLGAYQNRLGFAISYTENEIENIQASEAAIRDANIASEVTSFTRAQILSQAATAMLAQANVLPQNALALLQ